MTSVATAYTGLLSFISAVNHFSSLRSGIAAMAVGGVLMITIAERSRAECVLISFSQANRSLICTST